MPFAVRRSPFPAAATTHVTCIEVSFADGCAVDEALDQLRTLARALGMPAAVWSSEGASAVAVQAIDRRMAAAFGGRLRLAGAMTAQGGEARGWTGPAFLPRAHPLSAVPVGHQGIAVATADGHRFLHVLPAGTPTPDGPEEDVAGGPDAADDPPSERGSTPAPWTSPWLVRLGLPHTAPQPAFLCRLLVECGLQAEGVIADAGRESVAWARIGPCAGAQLAAAAVHLARTHRGDLTAWRALGAGPAASPIASLRYPRARCLATS